MSRRAAGRAALRGRSAATADRQVFRLLGEQEAKMGGGSDPAAFFLSSLRATAECNQAFCAIF